MTLARNVIERTYTIDEFMELPDIDDDKATQLEWFTGGLWRFHWQATNMVA